MRSHFRLVIIIVMLALAALYVALNPPRRLELGPDALSAFPLELGEWNGEELTFSDVVIEELDADATLARSYRDSEGRPVWFVIVFHQNERYGAHEPLVCYRAQGWGVVDSGVVTVARAGGDFDANWILVESGGTRRVALYWWYTAGDLATADRDKFLARMAAAGMKSNVTFGAFMRASTTVGAGGFEEALATVRRFAEEAVPHLPGLFEEDE